MQKKKQENCKTTFPRYVPTSFSLKYQKPLISALSISLPQSIAHPSFRSSVRLYIQINYRYKSQHLPLQEKKIVVIRPETTIYSTSKKLFPMFMERSSLRRGIRLLSVTDSSNNSLPPPLPLRVRMQRPAPPF